MFSASTLREMLGYLYNFQADLNMFSTVGDRKIGYAIKDRKREEERERERES